jgi:uncharacterized cofD-like protein
MVAVDALRALLGCTGKVWPITVEPASLCAEYADGSQSKGEVAVDASQSQGRWVERVWLEPQVGVHPDVARAIRSLDAVVVGPGSFYTSLMPLFLVTGVSEALATVRGPLVVVSNLLTEGRGMKGFTVADAVRRIGAAAGRPVDVVVANTGRPSQEVLDRYAAEHKEPVEIGDLPAGCELVTGDFWTRNIARHHRRRLAYAVWGILTRLLG